MALNWKSWAISGQGFVSSLGLKILPDEEGNTADVNLPGNEYPPG